MTRFSLKWKITIFVGIIIFSLMISFGIVVIYGEKQALLEKMEEIGHIITDSFADRALDPLVSSNFPVIHDYLESTRKIESIKYIIVLDDGGKCIAHSKRSFENKIFKENVYMNLLAGEYKSNSYTLKKMYTEENKKPIEVLEISKVIGLRNSREVYGAIIIGFSYDKINKEIKNTLMAIVYVTIVAIIIGFILAFLLSELVIRPITEMMGAVKAIGNGEYDVMVDVKSRDEIGIL
ncbi:HAMP domain-containing protein, partial [bacterium]|nr:HAMP domain-containing protein [bacterium]